MTRPFGSGAEAAERPADDCAAVANGVATAQVDVRLVAELLELLGLDADLVADADRPASGHSRPGTEVAAVVASEGAEDV
jgi:hypothetical protein